MKICPNCGKELEDDVKFCEKCGCAIESYNQNQGADTNSFQDGEENQGQMERYLKVGLLMGK